MYGEMTIRATEKLGAVLATVVPAAARNTSHNDSSRWRTEVNPPKGVVAAWAAKGGHPALCTDWLSLPPRPTEGRTGKAPNFYVPLCT